MVLIRTDRFIFLFNFIIEGILLLKKINLNYDIVMIFLADTSLPIFIQQYFVIHLGIHLYPLMFSSCSIQYKTP